MLNVLRVTRVFCGACLSLLAACATPDVLSNRAIDFNDTTARAADGQLLLNIVRAAYRNPTHYTAISQMRDVRLTEGSFETTATIPIGADAARIFTLVPKTNIKANASPSFDVVPLDNRAAAQGLFRPVDAQVLHTYWSQGWPKALLLALFVDTIQIGRNDLIEYCSYIMGNDLKKAMSTEKYVTIDVGDSLLNRSAHDVWPILVCLRDKLNLVERPKQTYFIRRGRISDTELLKKLPELQKDDFKVKQDWVWKPRQVGTKTVKAKWFTGTYTIWKSKKSWEFRLGKDEWANKEVEDDQDGEEKKKPSVVLRMRSVDGMIFFLGEIVRRQLQNEDVRRIPVGKGNVPNDVFRLHIDASRELGDRVEVEFLGKRFAIARKGDDVEKARDRTLTAFALISQLFALYRESTELPKTTAVQVVGSQ